MYLKTYRFGFEIVCTTSFKYQSMEEKPSPWAFSVGSICQPCCVKQPLGNILTKILLLHCNISVDGIDSKPDVSLSRTYKGWKKGQLPRKENAINAGLFLKGLLQARTDVR